ncbi:MAG: glycosyltransferase family 4 protein [Candidatus Coatesbacteria bacterium]|nr:glycosyltransferase family 4 protein [Candidatus Coatesbacteria bacterium]
MNGPRILYLCSDEGIDLFGMRGCSTHLREMCWAFKSLGCDLRLLHATYRDAGLRPFGIEYDIVKPLRSKTIGYDLRKILTNRRIRRRLRAIIKEFKPDFIYERYDLYSTAAADVVSKAGMPYLLEVNAPLIEEQRNELHFRRLAGIYQKRIFGKASLLIGVSEEICAMLQEISPGVERLVVENGVNEEAFNPSVSGAAIRNRFATDDSLIVGFIGSLKGWQGIGTLIRAASLILPRRQDVRFLVIGGGNRLTEYRKLVEELGLSGRFILTGPVPDNEIPACIAAFDICVAPYEPMQNFYFSSIKLREYIAMRKPIVASDFPPIRKMLRHGEDGLLASPGDEIDLAAKLNQLLDDSSLKERVAHSAYDRFAGRISWRSCASRILDAAEQLRKK